MAVYITACATEEEVVPVTEPEKEAAEETEAFDGEATVITDDYIPDVEDIELRFILEEVSQGTAFKRPLSVQNAGDGSGRLFVVEQAGLIYVLTGPEATEKELFLDIRDLVDVSGYEMGLLGLTFHPDYAENGYFFVNYTDNNGTVVARFEASGNKADPDSRQDN